MSSIAAQTLSQCDSFFARLASTRDRVLIVDYDGTLAPFVTERRQASPYPGMIEKLCQLRAAGSRVVVASGRMAREVSDLIGAVPPFEVWGSHGYERLLPTGEYRLGKCHPRLEDALHRAHEALVFQQLGKHVERKLCGIAVHWRGLPERHAHEAAVVAERTLRPLTEFNAALVGFDGGIELRARGFDKGHVVRTVMAECPAGTVAAFLGDDRTDEDGFLAVRRFGVAVLVRPEYRATAADIWLRPPEELASFLDQWHAIAGGVQ